MSQHSPALSLSPKLEKFKTTPIVRQFLAPSAQEKQWLLDHADLAPFPVGKLFVLENAYFRMGLPGTGPDMYLRDCLIQRLAKWEQDLGSQTQKGQTSFLVFDAFRTLECQMALFDHFVKEISARSPALSADEVEIEAAKFVAHPKFRPNYSALPHNTGAAIDVALGDCDNHEMWDFGTDFDDSTDLAATDFFERGHDPQFGISPERWNLIRQNRRVLFHIMRESGFANYSREWWHYNLGDSSWAMQVGADGPIFDSAEVIFNKKKKTSSRGETP